jgi:hypothetical protein
MEGENNMHSDIYVINHVDDDTKYTEDEAFEIFGENMVDYVSDVSEQNAEEAKKGLFKALKTLLEDKIQGDENNFTFSPDANIKYAEKILPGVKEYVKNLTNDKFSTGWSYVGMKNIYEPYNHILIIDPDGCYTNLDRFIKDSPYNQETYKISQVFDYHF